MSKEAMKLALEALGYIYEGANKQGPHTGISWRCVSNKAEPAITALREALAEPQEKYIYGTPLLDAMTGKANEALDKMAENSRELGLDYEPAQPQRWAVFCQGCRKEWSVSYPHPGKDICVDCDDKLAQQDSTCSNALRAQGKAYPRTCKKCGLGPCVELAQQALDKMAENSRELGLDYEPVCNKDPQGCWNVRCQLGKKCKNTPAQQEPVAKDNSNYRLDQPGLDPLYTSPPAQRTWQGLTDEDIDYLCELAYENDEELILTVQAKLKEKNT